VAMHQRGDVGEIPIEDCVAAFTESLYDFGNLPRIPNQDGVGNQTPAARIFADSVTMTGLR
jgi:hypothetical protein